MIVTKKLKLTTLLIAMVGILPTFASYRIAIPLETTQGGALPNGSIVIGDGTNPDTSQPPSSNCIYDGGTFVVTLTGPEDKFKVGDKFYWYNGTVIAWDSPTNGYNAPAGLSMGAFKMHDPESTNVDMHELCADDPSSYPPFVFPDDPGPPDVPDEPEPIDPDYTPECLPLDTTNNYAAYDKVAREYEYHSVTYGLNHVRANWTYKPADYDPNRPGSYQYLPEQNDTVSGPNPNYEYNAICRVNKRLE